MIAKKLADSIQRQVDSIRGKMFPGVSTSNPVPSAAFSATQGVGGTMLHSVYPYEQVAWVYTCVSLKEQSIQQLGYELVSDVPGQEGDKITQGPMIDLMENPNPVFDWWETIGSMSVWMDLEGEAFWLKEVHNGRLIYLWPLNPQYMTEQKDYSSGAIEYWRYSDPNIPYFTGEQQTTYKFRPEEIIHWKTYNPRWPLRGLSPLHAGRQSIDTDYAAHRFDEKVLANAGAIGGAYSTDNQLGQQQHAQLQDIIRSRYTGPDNAGKSILLHSGVKYDPTSWSPKELLLSELKHMSRTEICGLFKVPPQKVGIPESQTYSNYEEADKHYWTVAILPRARALVRKMTLDLCRHYQPGTRFSLDVTGIASLQDPLADKLDQGAKLMSIGYTLNQVNERLSLGMNEVEWGDEPFITTALASYESTVNPPEPVAAFPAPAASAAGLISRETLQMPAEFLRLPEGKNLDERLRREFFLAERLLAPQRLVEPKMERELNRYYREFRAAVLRRVDVWYGDEEAIRALQKKDLLFNPHQIKAPNLVSFVMESVGREVVRMWDRVSPYVSLVWSAGARQVQRVLGVDGLVDRLQGSKEEYDAGRGDWVTLNVERQGEVPRALAEALSAGESLGETASEISGRVKEVFEEVPDAERIALTEGVAALSAGRHEAGLESDAEFKMWLTVADEKVRHAKGDLRPLGWIQMQKELGTPAFYGMTPNHKILHGERVPVMAPFANGFQYPQSGGAIHGDDAGESINCFLPGQEVSGQFVAGSKARYAGQVIELETVRGYRLTVTPNHPILTPDGWIAAGQLAEGDHLISASSPIPGSGAFAGGAEHDQQCPALIENVFDALAAHGSVRVRPGSRLDFHGDGQGIDSHVDIVDVLGLLKGNVIPGIEQKLAKPAFAGGDPVGPLFDRFGVTDTTGDGSCGASGGGPSGTALAFNPSGGVLDPLPFQGFRFGLGAEWNRSFAENTGNNRPADSEVFRQLQDASSGQVTPDKIRFVKVRDFIGHVYDLQSVSGWMITQNICTHNCRCSAIYGLTSSPEEALVTWEEGL